MSRKMSNCQQKLDFNGALSNPNDSLRDCFYVELMSTWSAVVVVEVINLQCTEDPSLVSLFLLSLSLEIEHVCEIAKRNHHSLLRGSDKS